MLKSLKIENFRSWRDVELIFSKGINVIWGESQHGKTNCTFRALRLLKDNRPSSASFYSNFAPKKGSTEIELETYEGRKLSIKKNIEVKKDKESGKKVKKLISTEYMHDKRINPFTGIGRDVPDEIIDILNIGELNIQDQNEKPFLITETAGEVSRTINRITKLDRADQWISDLTTRINNSNKEIARFEGDIKKKEIELFKYDNLEEVENYISKAEKLSIKIERQDKELEEIAEILDRLDILINEIDVLEKVLEAEKYLESANDIEDKIDGFEIELKLIKEYLDICQDYLDIEQNGIELKEDLKEINSHYEKAESFNGEIELLEREKDLLTNYYTIYEEEEDLFYQISEGKKELKMLLKKMGKCPLCFGVVDNKCIERILKEI